MQPLAPADSVFPQPAPAALLQTLSRLEAELHHPGVRCSRPRLEALLHPAFHEVGRSGRRYHRATVIDHLAAQTTPPDVAAGGYQAQLLAPGVALLEYQSAHRSAAGEAAGLRDLTLRASVWCLAPHAGTPGSAPSQPPAQAVWQLLYHQGTPAAAGAAEIATDGLAAAARFWQPPG